eukprot:scaffold3296_cov405-Prasinococcus_capsulatus_cf.AAC.18
MSRRDSQEQNSPCSGRAILPAQGSEAYLWKPSRAFTFLVVKPSIDRLRDMYRGTPEGSRNMHHAAKFILALPAGAGLQAGAARQQYVHPAPLAGRGVSDGEL